MPQPNAKHARPANPFPPDVPSSLELRGSDWFLRDASITVAAWPTAVVGCVAHRFDD
jgi:hypothetical protein